MIDQVLILLFGVGMILFSGAPAFFIALRRAREGERYLDAFDVEAWSGSDVAWAPAILTPRRRIFPSDWMAVAALIEGDLFVLSLKSDEPLDLGPPGGLKKGVREFRMWGFTGRNRGRKVSLLLFEEDLDALGLDR